MEQGFVKRGISANTLKWIAIVCMLIDHIAWAFVPTESVLGFLMHTIGRITAPIMCFFIAEGYYRTRNVKRYALRLLVFAVISWPAFSFFATGMLFYPFALGMIWTLLMGLLALWFCEKAQGTVLKIAVVVVCCLLSMIGDWSIWGVLFILAFGLNSPLRSNSAGSFKKQALWFALVCLLMMVSTFVQIALQYVSITQFLNETLPNFGVLLALPLLFYYNGQRGGKPWMKWAFYIFYPAHLLILGVIMSLQAI